MIAKSKGGSWLVQLHGKKILYIPEKCYVL